MLGQVDASTAGIESSVSGPSLTEWPKPNADPTEGR